MFINVFQTLMLHLISYCDKIHLRACLVSLLRAISCDNLIIIAVWITSCDSSVTSGSGSFYFFKTILV